MNCLPLLRFHVELAEVQHGGCASEINSSFVLDVATDCRERDLDLDLSRSEFYRHCKGTRLRWFRRTSALVTGCPEEQAWQENCEELCCLLSALLGVRIASSLCCETEDLRLDFSERSLQSKREVTHRGQWKDHFFPRSVAKRLQSQHPHWRTAR